MAARAGQKSVLVKRPASLWYVDRGVVPRGHLNILEEGSVGSAFPVSFAPAVFDRRLYRSSFKATTKAAASAWVWTLAGRARAIPLIAAALGAVFWAGTAIRIMRTQASSHISSYMSTTSSQYLVEFVPYVLLAVILLSFARWGSAWIIPAVFVMAGWLGYVRQDLSRPPEVFTVPAALRDGIVTFFGWGNGHPTLKIYFLLLAVLPLLKVSIRISHQQHKRPVYTGVRRARFPPRRRPWRRLPVMRAAVAVALASIAQIALLWSLLLLQSGVEGSERVDQRALDSIAEGIGGYLLVLFVAGLSLCTTEGRSNPNVFRGFLLLAAACGVSNRILSIVTVRQAWLGDLFRSATEHVLGMSIWVALAGTAICFLAIQGLKRISGGL